MFREKGKSMMREDTFGVGSVIALHTRGIKYLVMGDSTTNRVYLLNLKNFKRALVEVAVEDINHLTENEVRNLVLGLSIQHTLCLNIQNTFSDFTFDAKGLKPL